MSVSSSDDQRINLEFLEFPQYEADTYGMEKKFGKLQIGIKLNDGNLKVLGLVEKYKTKNPVKKNDMLYLKANEAFLSKKQKNEILNKGPMCVKVLFDCTGVFENLDNDVRYLVFKLNGLKKVSDENGLSVLDDF